MPGKPERMSGMSGNHWLIMSLILSSADTGGFWFSGVGTGEGVGGYGAGIGAGLGVGTGGAGVGAGLGVGTGGAGVGAGLGVGSGTGGEGVGEGVGTGTGVGAEEQLTSPHSEPAKVTVREAGGFVHYKDTMLRSIENERVPALNASITA